MADRGPEPAQPTDPTGTTGPTGATGHTDPTGTAGRIVPVGLTDLAEPLTQDLDVDAVVIGAGPNGLVAACLLARAGWDVVVLERNHHLGGAVASVERTPGYVSDLYSAFYPLAAASPVLAELDLHSHGLHWRRTDRVLAHVPHPRSGIPAILHPDPEHTAAALDAEAPGDGLAWLSLVEQWRTIRDPFLQCLFTPFPPVAGVARLLARTGSAQALRLARQLLLPVDRLGAELFRGKSGPLLLAGNAMHADVPADAPGSGAFGWVLAMLGQDVGFPVPQGGAGMLAQALARCARSAGAGIHAPAPVTRILAGGGRALGVVAGGHRIRARRAVLADVAAPDLYRRLLPADQVPAGFLAELDRCFTWDLPTVKVNWALRGRVPWRVGEVGLAGTVHLGTDLAGLSEWSSAICGGRPSQQLFQIVGQLATADPGRAPTGGESLWAYSHLPRGPARPHQAADLARRMEEGLEQHAPGFGDLVVDRWEQMPGDLEAGNPNLVDGAVNGGTAQLFQQLVFRPLPGPGRPETLIEGLYLAGASAGPGGGVHGGNGAMAARAALQGARFGRLPRRLLVTVTRRLGVPAELRASTADPPHQG